MVVAGRLSQKMAPVIRRLYEQMPSQVGNFHGCLRHSGGVFNNYALLQGVNQVVPVDVYVPDAPRVRNNCFTQLPFSRKKSSTRREASGRP